MEGFLLTVLTHFVTWCQASQRAMRDILRDKESVDTVLVCKSLECLLLLTPLTVVAMTGLVVAVDSALCTGNSETLYWIFTFSTIAATFHAIGVQYLWCYWWNSAITVEALLFDQFVVSFVTQATRTVCALALLVYVLHGATWHEDNTIPVCYLAGLMMLELLASLTTLTNYVTISSFVSVAVSGDNVSSVLYSMKVFVLLLLVNDLQGYHEVKSLQTFTLFALLITLTTIQQFGGSLSGGLFHYKYPFLVLFVALTCSVTVFAGAEDPNSGCD
jgi:hypothetical protein